MNTESHVKPAAFVPRFRQIGLFVIVSLLCWVAQPAAMDRVEVSLELGQPILQWSNSIGQAYAIQTTINVDSPLWQTEATVTADAPFFVWMDERLLDRARFYRIALVTNAAPFQSLQQALQRACVNQGIVGASAAVVFPNQGLWLGTYGRARGTNPVRSHTRFEIGSVTKTFVAATILRLAEEGRLTLDDTVSQWLPALNHPNISPVITIRQLLNHWAGTHNFGDDPDFRAALFSDWSRYWQPEEVLNYVKTPYHAPGAGSEYSNTGYVLLGMIIRSVTGSTVAAEMRRAVWDRAGLRSTVMGAEENWRGTLADPHLDFNGDGIHEALGDRSQTAILSAFWTSGAVVSTAADVARFGSALFNGELLNETSLAQMRSFQSLDIIGTTYEYGFGLMRFDILGREHWAHSGGLFGEYAWLSYCPSTDVSLAVTYNYPQTKATGASLPGELLIALSTLGDSGWGSPATRTVKKPTKPPVRIPFLKVKLPSE